MLPLARSVHYLDSPRSVRLRGRAPHANAPSNAGTCAVAPDRFVQLRCREGQRSDCFTATREDELSTSEKIAVLARCERQRQNRDRRHDRCRAQRTKRETTSCPRPCSVRGIQTSCTSSCVSATLPIARRAAKRASVVQRRSLEFTLDRRAMEFSSSRRSRRTVAGESIPRSTRELSHRRLYRSSTQTPGQSATRATRDPPPAVRRREYRGRSDQHDGIDPEAIEQRLGGVPAKTRRPDR